MKNATLESSNPGTLTSKIVKVGEARKIQINDEIFDPLAFRSFFPEERNISEFHDAGVRLMSILSTGQLSTAQLPYAPFGETWVGHGKYEFERFDQQIEMFIKHAPEAYFNIMLQFDTKDWYLKEHPEYGDSYWNLEKVAGDPKWREDAAQYLRDAISYIEGKWGHKVFAYSLFCGGSTEWFTGKLHDDPADPIEEACYQRYLDDSEARIPELSELLHCSNGVLRDPVADREALDYYRFRHEIVADTLLFFAKEARKIIGGNKLIGAFYGYLNIGGGAWLLDRGHLAFDSVFKSPDINMFFAPAAYGSRRMFNGTSEYQVPVDSMDINNKIFFQENDHATYVAPSKLKNGLTPPGTDSKLKNEFETRMVLRREFTLTTIKRTGMWWFDFFGGYYYAEPLMKEVANMVRVKKRLKNISMHSISEIAVFGDGPSMYSASAESAFSNSLLLTGGPVALRRIGAPFEMYSFDDLDNPALDLDRYKLVIFLNTFTVSEEKRFFIEERVKKQDRSLLWLYAPGYIKENGFSLESMRSLTGINFALREGTDSRIQLNNEDILSTLSSNVEFGFDKEISPLFQIDDPKVKVLGNYVSGNQVALGYKKMPEFKSYYCASGNVPSALYREIARAAGVHIYYEGNDPIYVNNRLIGIHMQSDETSMLTMPGAMNVKLEELFDGGELTVENGSCAIPREEGVVKLYLINQKQILIQKFDYDSY